MDETMCSAAASQCWPVRYDAGPLDSDELSPFLRNAHDVDHEIGTRIKHPHIPILNVIE
jgi:hypothetical protein